MAESPIVVLRDSRLRKKAELQRLGINPYPSRASRTHDVHPILSNYEGLEGATVTVAGRLMSLRKQGGLCFGHVQDETGRIQLFIRRDTISPTDAAQGTLGFSDLHSLDVGDIVEAAGVVTKTKAGETSVLVHHLRILTKSLRPLPDKWSGLKDRELILRKRYLDVIAVPAHRERFAAISRMLWTIRAFLHEKGFHEVITPVLQPQYGGGTAKPFRTHVNALGYDAYLSISHELYLKRMIVAGYDKVYTIGKYFRNEGIDRSHHPEFSMVETMTAYEDFRYNMDLIEDMFGRIAREAFGRSVFDVRGHKIDFGQPWTRVSMSDLVEQITGIDFRAFSVSQESNEALKSLGLQPQPSVGHAIAHAFEAVAESRLIAPTLVYGHPVEISPLAKPSAEDPRFAERFEIFIAGMECGDNWSEENDPVALLAHWQRAKEDGRGDDDTHPLDYDFIEALEFGMPPTTGIGPGIERMAMIFTGEENIDDVIFFPLLRPLLSETNREIYALDATAQTAGLTDESAVPVEIAELEHLIRHGTVRPLATHLRVRPFLRIWQSPSILGRWHASGYARVDGFFEGKELLLVGYQSESEVPIEAGRESASLVDAIDLGFTAILKELVSSKCEVHVSATTLVRDPS